MKKDETKREPAEPAPGTRPGDGKAEAKDGAAKPGMKYVFKIAPADPKNAFDFEDVADK